ncbi:hypothetical protein [Pseudogemmobacter bohemicus]|uniref:hypothetical protein n=1 Tax=Pseudogemmobacter bohemicus TaxID=2250708 RepID=UPI000DD4CAA7|nr:hypothetical protein [Pseudogemmobacter bohemicus]
MSVLTAESPVVICQRALGLAEARNRFTSLEDRSSEAQEARLRYDARRRSVLEALDWGFARRRVVGQDVAGEATPPGLPRAWALPPECLRIRAVYPMGCDRLIRHSREEYVYTEDHGPVQIVFTRDIHNPVLFAPAFTQALEFLLASEFSMVFARSVNRADVMLSNFRAVMQEADALEAAERSNIGEAYEAGAWADAISFPWMGAR